MATGAGTLQLLARELAELLRPLEQRLDAGGADRLFAELGLRLPSGLSSEAQLANALASGATAAAGLAQLIAQLSAAIDAEDVPRIVTTGQALLQRIQQVIDAIPPIATGLDQVTAGFRGLTPDERAEIQTFAQELPRRLIDFLVVEYLETKAPAVAPSLALIGLIDRAPDAGVPGNALRPPYIRRSLHPERLPKLLSDPAGFLRDVYAWGDPTFDGLALFDNLQRFIEDELDMPADLLAPPGQAAILEAYLFSVRVYSSTNPPGLIADFRFPATQDFERTYALRSPWSLRVAASGRFVADVEVRLTPPAHAALRPPTGTVDLAFTAGLTATDASSPMLLLGEPAGTRLEATHVSASLGIAASWDSLSGRASGEPLALIDVRGGKLVLGMAKGDGFIQTILAGTVVESSFELKASWRPSTGIVFDGGAGLELVVPTHLNLGPIEIRTLGFRLGFTNQVPLQLELTAAIAATLGPISMTLDGIGATVAFTFPPQRNGALGPLDLDIAFRPPTGLGALVHAGPISGGGFLTFDPENRRYAGMLQLEAAGIAINAIGLLDTRLPGGASGYSFLILASAAFPPIQLGYGFTLNGVGGLAGIHRTVITDALRQGLLAGSLDQILFPLDPVRNAPQIISDLRAVFPPATNRYVFGPILKLGWGVPSLISANLGVILDLPDPFRMVILGQAKVTIPAPELAIVSLNLDILGIIDFEERLLAIDATLYDSYVATFSVYGDVAMRLFWGEPPIFALAIGGLHPQFRPPPGFPTLRRAIIEIGTGENPRLTCQSYFAVTSNSVQTGSRIELYAAAGDFNIHGWLGYDALVNLRPLAFLVDIDGGVELRHGTRVMAGIHVDAHLSGPSPWRAWGEACLSLLFFDICVPFSITVGSAQDQPTPSLDPMPLLKAALEDPRNWQSGLPHAAFRAVSFSIPSGSRLTLIDPVGSLTVQQKVLPLNRKLEKFGEAALLGPDRYDVSGVTSGTNDVAFSAVCDYFAAGQFQRLSDAEKLSRDSYELMDAGLTISANAVTNGATRAVPIDFETIIMDAPDGFHAPFTTFVARHVGRSAATQSSLLAHSERVYSAHLARNLRDPYGSSAGVIRQVELAADEAYVIASTEDLAVRTDLGAPGSKTEASTVLAEYLATHPDERGGWKVVPVHEIEAVS